MRIVIDKDLEIAAKVAAARQNQSVTSWVRGLVEQAVANDQERARRELRLTEVGG